MASKTTLTEVYRPSKQALEWLARNMSFGLAIEGIASGEFYYVLKLKNRAQHDAYLARRAKKAAPIKALERKTKAVRR